MSTTPVYGANNLDNGIGLGEASQHPVFAGMAKDMLGIEEPDLENENEEVEEETEEEVEAVEEDSDEEQPDESEEPSEESEEEETEETETEGETFIVTVDGKEVEVSSEELLNGYQRQSDYTRKTQEVADERKRVSKYADELNTEREKYTTALADLIEADKIALKEYEEIDWAKLKAEDKNEFLIKQYELNEARNSLQAKVDKRNEALKQAQAEKDIEVAEMYKRESQRAKEIVDGWEGEEHDALVASLKAQAESIGFTESENDLFKHAIVIKLLQRSKELDDILNKQKNVSKKKLERKVPPVVTPGAKKKAPEKTVRKFKDSMDKLKQTGNIRDSVGAFEAFI